MAYLAGTLNYAVSLVMSGAVFKSRRSPKPMPYFKCPKCEVEQYSAYDFSECEKVNCIVCKTSFANPHYDAKRLPENVTLEKPSQTE